MPIQDSSPERRNLTVMATFIVLFYIAGGRLEDKEIKLQLINVSFTNIEILASTVWIILCWFAFRYWQKFNGELTKVFNKNASNISLEKLAGWYLAKCHKIENHIELGCKLRSRFEKTHYHWIIKYEFITNIQLNEDGSFSSFTVPPELNDKESNYVNLGLIS